MKSTILFSRILGIDALLSFDGVVSSLAEFHLKLTSLIEQFSNELIAEDKPFDDCEALCKIICGYLDQHINARHGDNQTFGQRYSLMHYFYGYTGEEDKPSKQLAQLMDTRSETIFSCAFKLLTLLARLNGRDAELAQLHTDYSERHFQWHPAPAREATPDAPPQDTATSAGVLPRLVVFIIGPFAAKWFQQTEAGEEVDGTLWLLAPNVKTLERRLESIRTNEPGARVMAYFPIIPEGFENASILIGQIADWQLSLASVALPQRIPCMLAFYARLSQERFSHDQDRAVWSGELSTQPSCGQNVERELEALIATLGARDNGRNIHLTQRYSLASTLFAWMTENRITGVLQKLFDAAPLDLAGITLADYSNGFVRHGAWSHWLAEKYGIVPGLAATIPMPPLPSIHQHREEAEVVAATGPGQEEKKAGCRIWLLLGIIAAVLAIALATYAYLFSRTENHAEFITPNITQYWEVNAEDLKEAGAPSGETTGDAAETPEQYAFTLSSMMPMFEHGSAALIPGSEKALEEILPVIVNSPDTPILIIGHSDNTGSAEVNLRLSTQRALVIRDWLMAQSGLPADHFQAGGAGSSRPVAGNDTEEGRSKNRRVEIIPLSQKTANQ